MCSRGSRSRSPDLPPGDVGELLSGRAHSIGPSLVGGSENLLVALAAICGLALSALHCSSLSLLATLLSRHTL